MTMTSRTPLLALALTACPLPPAGEDESGVSESSDGGSDGESGTDSDTTDEGGCPVGVEGCPCTDASTCFPSLECVEGLCLPADPCPVGASGCPCTNFGTCDPGSTCLDGVCQCEAGELGCECLDGGCSNALDCVEGLCSIPALVSEAADGWGPVTCWGYRVFGAAPQFCTAARGDVVYRVRSACEVAENLLSGFWLRHDEWVINLNIDLCSAGEPLPLVADPWDDVACFVSELDGQVCLGRIGHLWVEVKPECSNPPLSTFQPWGVDASAEYGCDDSEPPGPTVADIDEWMCGPLAMPNESTLQCVGRIGSLWTRRPEPPCFSDTFDDAGEFGLFPVDWSPWACESADD